MEMSQKIHILYQILLKMLFLFLKNGKKITFSVNKICDKLKK